MAQIPFINREDELAQIDALIREWGTRRVLCIHAKGGIGKTRLLQEVDNRYAEESVETAPLLVADIIDFDERSFHLVENVGRGIAERLSEEVFKTYLRRLLDYHKMERAGVSPERLAEESQAINKTFVDCFDKISAHRRVVLLFDTTDALKKAEVWDYLSSTAMQLQNTLFLIAGRNAKEIWKRARPEMGEDIQLLELQPLEEKAGESYLRQKQISLHISLEPEIAKKLLVLAGGKPILIDLAVEWLARDIPLDWLVASRLDELASLTAGEIAERRQEFERHLVHHITQIRTPIDRLILVMSRVYPLDVEMIAEMLEIPTGEAEALFEEAKGYVFVKPLPDNRISLHDEMRRMVNEYVWPEVDPDGSRQRRDSELAAAHLARKVQALKERIEQLKDAELTAREKGDAEAELEAFMEQEAAERELWVLEGQRLQHTLLADLDKGVRVFAELFDEATRAYRFYFRGNLISQMQPYSDRLSPAQSYELDNRRIKHMLGLGEYTQTKKLVTKILQGRDVLPGRQVDMLIHRGNAVIRLGQTHEAVEDFLQAMEISKREGFAVPLIKAGNALGWAYRRMGRLDEAAQSYRDALKLSLEIGERKREGWLLHQLGYVYALQRQQDAAVKLCHQAVKTWKEIGLGRGLGAAYSTLGEVHSEFERLDKSLEFFQKALDIFQAANDIEWLSTAYTGRGRAHWLAGNLDMASSDLKWAQQHGPRMEQPRILHRLAYVYWTQGDLEQAERHFERSRQLAQEVFDALYEITSLGQLAGLAYQRDQYERLDEFEQMFSEYRRRLPDVTFNISEGLLFKNLGDLAMRSEQYERALEFYRKGFPMIARQSIYEPYSITGQLEDCESNVLPFVPDSIVRELGQRIQQQWEEEGLDFTNPEALPFFGHWRRWGE